MSRCRLFLVLFLFVSIAQAEDGSAASPERVIRDFYQWYVGALVKNHEPFTKERAQLKKYASERLIREIDHVRKGPDGLDGDYFLDAQDFDQEWGKNITVSTPVIAEKKATTMVELKSKAMGTRKLRVTLTQENGGWKVDKVEGQH